MLQWPSTHLDSPDPLQFSLLADPPLKWRGAVPVCLILSPHAERFNLHFLKSFSDRQKISRIIKELWAKGEYRLEVQHQRAFWGEKRNCKGTFKMRKANFLNCGKLTVSFVLWYFHLNKPGWREQDCASAYSMCVCDYWTRALPLALADGVKWALVSWQARLSLVVVKIRILSACSTRHNIRMRKWVNHRASRQSALKILWQRQTRDQRRPS